MNTENCSGQLHCEDSSGRALTAAKTALQGSEETQNRPAPLKKAMPERALIVEDSILIALDTEEILKRLGISAVTGAGSVSQALTALANELPDIAFVDFNLGAESSLPVIEALRGAGVPFVLATGYAGMSARISEMHAIDIMRKPYGSEEIEQVLAKFADSAAGFKTCQLADWWGRVSNVTRAWVKSTASRQGANRHSPGPAWI